MDAFTVLSFWFEELSPKQWWMKDDKLDNDIRERFSDLHWAAVAGELSSWRSEPMGRLAEIIVIDQFSRNIFRNDPRAFQFDPVAVVLTQTAIATGDDQKVPIEKRSFLYMPFMHSESRLIHEQAVEVFSQKGLEGALDFEMKHKAIVDRFGRYPHRNEALGRKSTPEEIEFLKGPGSSF